MPLQVKNAEALWEEFIVSSNPVEKAHEAFSKEDAQEQRILHYCLRAAFIAGVNAGVDEATRIIKEQT